MRPSGSWGKTLGRLDEAGFGGLTVSQAFAVQLVESGVSTITALAEVMGMTPQAVSAIVNRLQERGFVIRGRQASDGRSKVLTLTDDGRRLASEISRALTAVEMEWAALAGGERLAEVREALAAFVSDGSLGDPTQPHRRTVRFV